MTDTVFRPDDGETIFSCEPLLPAEDGDNWRRLSALALEVRTLSDKLALLAPRAGATSPEEVLDVETRASFLIEGEVASDNDLRSARRAFAAASERPWLSEEMLCEAHRAIAEGQFDAEPGRVRSVRVAVGNHVAPSPGAVPRLLAHMSRTYGRAGRTARLISAVSGHHRLSWVHPFRDWNGRVGRLATTCRLRAELPAAERWSMSEGLLEQCADYMRLMAAADEARRGDRDGRGNLSEMRLTEVSGFLLEIVRDRIEAAIASHQGS